MFPQKLCLQFFSTNSLIIYSSNSAQKHGHTTFSHVFITFSPLKNNSIYSCTAEAVLRHTTISLHLSAWSFHCQIPLYTIYSFNGPNRWMSKLRESVAVQPNSTSRFLLVFHSLWMVCQRHWINYRPHL